MRSLSGKLKFVKMMKGANRRDRRSRVDMFARETRKAWTRAVRRDGKAQAQSQED
jgi:hypothetical protein